MIEHTYAIVDYDSKTLITTRDWYGQAHSVLTSLPVQRAAVIHNITHPKCPVWVKNLVKAQLTLDI